MDQVKAAEYMVVAWAKNWTLRTYVEAVLGKSRNGATFQDFAKKAHDLFPWVVDDHRPLMLDQTVRAYLEDQFPRLSDWLWARGSDTDRLKAAPQIMRLVAKAGRMRERDKQKLVAGREKTKAARAMSEHRLLMSSHRTHSRSAWTTCKA